MRRFAPPAVTALAVLVLAAGCGQGADVADLMDDGSRTRLAGIGGNEMVLLSITGSTPIRDLPPLGEGGKVVGRSGNSVLLEIPRADVLRLSEVDGLRSAVIWGDNAAARRIEPALRAQLLEHLDAGPAATAPLEMLATFREKSPELRDRLTRAGAQPRTVAGRVVTVTAGPEAIFAMLAMPDLVNLTRPRVLRTLEDR